MHEGDSMYFSNWIGKWMRRFFVVFSVLAKCEERGEDRGAVMEAHTRFINSEGGVPPPRGSLKKKRR